MGGSSSVPVAGHPSCFELLVNTPPKAIKRVLKEENMQVVCQKCGEHFDNRFQRDIDTMHRTCMQSSQILYEELFEYIKSLPFSNAGGEECVTAISPIVFDQILQTRDGKYKKIVVAERQDVLLSVEKAKKVGMIKIIIRCKLCNNFDQFQCEPCVYVVPVAEIEEKLIEVVEDLRNKVIPPCKCIRIQEKECVVCMDKKANVYLAPCQHVVLCSECANNWLVKRNNVECPFCKQTILKRVNL